MLWLEIDTHIRGTSLKEKIARRVTSSTTATTSQIGCRTGLNEDKIETRSSPYHVDYAPHDGTQDQGSAWFEAFIPVG